MMERLIKLRLHASQLQPDELSLLIQSIIASFGNEKIISFAFNNFLYKHQHSPNKHQPDLEQIITMTKDIIQSRKSKEKSKDKKNKIVIKSANKTNPDPSNKIDAIPPDMTREIASYLTIKDYYNFAISNRIIYINCNTPCALTEMTINKNKHYDFRLYRRCLNLTRLPFLKTLYANPIIFNKYMKYQQINININKKTFEHMKCLSLNRGNTEELENFINSDYINFENIEQLDCGNFEWVSLQLFCDLLEKCKNVKKLSLFSVNLIGSQPAKLNSLLPKLEILNEYGNNFNTNGLRNLMIEKYQNQITALNYSDILSMITYDKLNKNAFPKLHELLISISKKESIANIINMKAPNLRRFWLDIKKANDIENEMKNIMEWLFTKCLEIEFIAFEMNCDKVHKFVELMETTLFNRDGNKYKKLKMLLQVFKVGNDIKVDEMLPYISRMANAINVEVLEFVLDFKLWGSFDEINKSKKDKLVNNLKINYLVFQEIDTSRKIKCQRFVVYRKNCKINGFRQKLDTLSNY